MDSVSNANAHFEVVSYGCKKQKWQSNILSTVWTLSLRIF